MGEIGSILGGNKIGDACVGGLTGALVTVVSLIGLLSGH